MTAAVRCSPDGTGVLLVDWQERLAPAMAAELHAPHLRNAERLLQGAALFRVPAVATEQYPKGLGPTLPSLKALLAGEGLAAPIVEKIDFSAWAVPAVREQMSASGRRSWIVAGMEAHVCVFQTVRDLCEAGHTVWLLRDAVVSRTRENWEVGVELCRAAGARVASTESVLFDLCGRAEGEAFKALSRLVR